MTVARENQDMTIEASTLREWIRPSVQQLAAGSAEDQAGPDFDGITNPS
ncbi:MAG TPA: hypothetical protein VE891_14370 [Allosphingosinicella sp.]|nr:hypothetical protein [Allosphingosinicella sp.]